MRGSSAAIWYKHPASGCPLPIARSPACLCSRVIEHVPKDSPILDELCPGAQARRSPRARHPSTTGPCFSGSRESTGEWPTADATRSNWRTTRAAELLGDLPEPGLHLGDRRGAISRQRSNHGLQEEWRRGPPPPMRERLAIARVASGGRGPPRRAGLRRPYLRVPRRTNTTGSTRGTSTTSIVSPRPRPRSSRQTRRLSTTSRSPRWRRRPRSRLSLSGTTRWARSSFPSHPGSFTMPAVTFTGIGPCEMLA